MPDRQDGREERASTAEHPDGTQESTENSERRDTGSPDDEKSASDSADETGDLSDVRGCHRRGCENPVSFLALERYQEETGHGAVEATAALCRDHAAEESPANLDRAYDEYIFRVEPVDSRQGDEVKRS